MKLELVADVFLKSSAVLLSTIQTEAKP